MEENVIPQGLARITEATQYLGLSKSKLYMMMDKGQVTYVKIGKSRRIRWSELFKLVERHTVPASND